MMDSSLSTPIPFFSKLININKELKNSQRMPQSGSSGPAVVRKAIRSNTSK